jgi:transcriptional regulator with XRE-family HTH domain
MGEIPLDKTLIGERIFEILDSKKHEGKSQKGLADYLDISQQKVTDWKAGRVKSYMNYLDKIAAYLNVSIYDLHGIEQKEKPTILSDDELNEETEKIMRMLQNVPKDKLYLVENIARALIDAEKNR